MIVTAQDCHHCNWHSIDRPSGLPRCGYHNQMLITLFWNHRRIECNHYEPFRYEEGKEDIS